jgi:transposase-like protein
MDDTMRATSNKRFPVELKESVVRRYLSTDVSIKALADEIGGSSWSVRDWVKEYRERGTVGKQKKNRATTTDSRSPEEKLRLVVQAKALSEAERGQFLRTEGIHDGDLERWEQDALGGLRGGQSGESQSRRIRELERDSERKDRRLKEASALLDLQKKVHALWGDADDDTSKS